VPSAVLSAASGVVAGAVERQQGAACLKLFLLAIIFLQRFAIPISGQQIPLLLPVGLVILGAAYLRGELSINSRRAPLVATMWITALGCTLLHVAFGSVPSLLAVVLLLLLYLPALFSPRVSVYAGNSIAGMFVAIMTVMAIVSVVQFALQYVGIANEDYLSAVLPSDFLLGGCHQRDPIAYGSDLRRSNALVFLEPSFLSLFLALAVLLAIRAGRGWAQMCVLLAGLVPTLAGNGLVVLIPGVAVLAFIVWRNLLSLLPGVVIALVAAVASPLGAIYLGRSSEASNPQTSSSFRFVQPYTTLVPESVDSPLHAIIGHGAGTAGAYLQSVNLTAVTEPAIAKVFYEYGAVGIIGIIVPLLAILFIGLRSRPWMFGLVVAFVFINASLLLTTLVFFTLFWIVLVPLSGRRSVGRPLAPAHLSEKYFSYADVDSGIFDPSPTSSQRLSS